MAIKQIGIFYGKKEMTTFLMAIKEFPLLFSFATRSQNPITARKLIIFKPKKQ
jgi:hypothetical protein